MRTCSVEGCDKVHKAKGYCRNHYKAFKKHENPLLGNKHVNICSVDGCGKKHFAKNYCRRHYLSFVKYGDPLQAKVLTRNGVLNWENILPHYNNQGYLMLTKSINSIKYTKLVHRYIWEKYNGDIPKGSIIHHINGIKTDYRIENLQCLTKSNHTILHQTKEQINE